MTDLVAEGGVLSLARVDFLLAAAGAYEGIRAVRLAVAGDLRLDPTGLRSDTRLREALVLVTDNALRAAVLSLDRLETIDRVLQTVLSQA